MSIWSRLRVRRMWITLQKDLCEQKLTSRQNCWTMLHALCIRLPMPSRKSRTWRAMYLSRTLSGRHFFINRNNRKSRCIVNRLTFWSTIFTTSIVTTCQPTLGDRSTSSKSSTSKTFVDKFATRWSFFIHYILIIIFWQFQETFLHPFMEKNKLKKVLRFPIFIDFMWLSYLYDQSNWILSSETCFKAENLNDETLNIYDRNTEKDVLHISVS